MKHLFRSSLCLLAIIACANFGDQVSSRKDKPDVNIKGTVITHAGEKIPAQNITISGKYEQIKVYKKQDSVTDPKRYPATLDLDEVTEINVLPITKSLFTYNPPEEKKEDGSIRKPRPVEYIVISATYKNGEKKEYLIERRMKFWFDEKIGDASAEQTPHIEAVKKITLEKIIPQQTADEQADQTGLQMHQSLDDLEKTAQGITSQTGQGLQDLHDKIMIIAKDLRAKLTRILN